MSTEPKVYRKLPVNIEAIQFPLGGTAQGEVARWIRDSGGEANLYDGNVRQVDTPFEDGSYFHWVSMSIKTLEGTMNAHPGDYIIKGVEGEFYPCRPDIFQKTYEAAE